MPIGSRLISKGNLFASTATAIAKITPDGTINPSFATGLNFFPTGLAFDAAGNLYAGDSGGGGQVFKITPTGTKTQFEFFCRSRAQRSGV